MMYGKGTPSLDLPQELMQIMQMPQPGVNPMGPVSMPQQNSPMSTPYGMPGYAMGGMVGPQGAPMPQGAPAPQISLDHINQDIASHPELLEHLAAQLMPMVERGEVSPEQMQMAGQLAETALQNPELYPQIRQFAIEQGMVNPQDIPEQYDQGFLTAIILAARSVTQGSAAAPPSGVSMDDMPSYADGGYIRAGDKAAKGGKIAGPGGPKSDNIPILASPGEYVIPAHIVQMKGKEFFDNMLNKYRES